MTGVQTCALPIWVLAGSANLTFDGTTLTAGGLSTGGSVTLSGGTANGVLYLNGSKVATSGSALTFDGSALTITSGSLNLGAGGANGFISGNTWYGINTGDWNFQAGNGSQQFAWKNSSGGDWMRLTSTGLGIGTSSPAAKLDIYQSSVRYVRAYPSSGLADLEVVTNNNSQPVFAVKGTGTADLIRAYAGATQALTLDSSGNLGIGTSSPAYKLDVNGNAQVGNATASTNR